MAYKKQILQHGIIMSIFITCLIAATFLDQRLAEYAYIGEGISIIGAVIGKMPAWIFFIMGSTILYKNNTMRDRGNKSRTPLAILYFIMILGGSFMLAYSIVDDVMVGIFKKIIIVLITCCTALLAVMIATRLSADIVMKLRKWAILAVLVVCTVVVITLLVKIVWGRARYVEIIIGDAVFTPWYKINGFTGGSSMPSGHTALAGTLFLLPLMFMALPRMKAYSSTATAVTVLFIVFIATTRIMGGYHFFSDVAISSIIVYLTTVSAGYIFYGKKLSNTTINEGHFLSKL